MAATHSKNFLQRLSPTLSFVENFPDVRRVFLLPPAIYVSSSEVMEDFILKSRRFKVIYTVKKRIQNLLLGLKQRIKKFLLGHSSLARLVAFRNEAS